MRVKLLVGLASRPYALYVLLVLMIVFLLNQADRFILGVCSEEISRDLQFGERECLVNQSDIGKNVSCDANCHQWKSFEQCNNGSMGEQCVWDYSGTGIEYQLLAGPVFMLVFTTAAIPLGLLASYKCVNRHYVLSVAVLLWTLTTLATSFSQTFWMLLLLRAGLGMFEAVCTPFASGIIADYYDKSLRATAFSVYYLGVYIGYSLAFAFALLVTTVGWRWVYRIATLPGIIVTVVLLVTVREPPRLIDTERKLLLKGSLIKLAIQSYCHRIILLISIAAGVRMTGGIVWAYNVRSFYDHYYCGEVNVGAYLSWIPLLGGIIGATAGGYVADQLAKRYGQMGRLVVLVTSQGIAAPFAAGAVYLPPPYGLICLLPAYILGEMWIGTSLAVVTHLVPPDVVSLTVAIYTFIINNIGSSLNLLVPVLSSAIGLRVTMLLMFAGSYLLAAILFLLTSTVYCCTRRHAHLDAANRETDTLLHDPSRMINDELEESTFDDDDDDDDELT